METIGFQSRGKNNEKLVEKPIKMHPDVYDRFCEVLSEAEGFTMANLVNEALAHFVGAGDLSRSIEFAEERLESRSVSLPPHSRSEVTQKNTSVLDGEKSFNQVYDVTSHKEWKYLNKEDSTIYPNTNVDMWESLKEYPGRVAYVAQVAIIAWLDNPFDGMFNYLISLQQMQAAVDGEDVSSDEATEWVQRRIDCVRPQSDGDHHNKWEALFNADSSGVDVDISSIRVDDNIEISEERAIEARKADNLTEGANRPGVLRAVMRSKSTTNWDRKGVAQLNERINGDMQTESTKDGYVDTVIDSLDDYVVLVDDVDDWVEGLKQDIVEEHGPEKGATNASGLSKRCQFKQEKLAWIDEMVGDNLTESYKTFEAMGSIVRNCVCDVVDANEDYADSAAVALITLPSLEAWEAEGLFEETNADDLEVELNELDFVHGEVVDICDAMLGLNVEMR